MLIILWLCLPDTPDKKIGLTYPQVVSYFESLYAIRLTLHLALVDGQNVHKISDSRASLLPSLHDFGGFRRLVRLIFLTVWRGHSLMLFVTIAGQPLHSSSLTHRTTTPHSKSVFSVSWA